MKHRTNGLISVIGLIVISVGVFLLMALLNNLSGYSADDYLYHFFFTGEWPAKHLRGIHNGLDLIQSVQNHTRLFNGRFVAHTWVMTMMQFPKTVFNVVNALVFVVVGWLMNIHVFGKQRIKVGFLALTFTLMWFGLPDYGTTILWLSGAINYLWMALIYLLFLLPYRFNYQAHHPTLMAVGMSILGFLAGATNENTAPLTLFIALAFTLFDWQKSQLAWKWCGGLFGALGFYIMVKSGSQQIAVRGKQFEIGKLIQNAGHYSGWLLVLTFGLLIYLYWQHHTYGHHLVWRQQRTFVAAWLYGVGAVLGIVALVVSPQILSRVFFGPNLYFIIAILLALRDHALLRQGTWLVRLLPISTALMLGFLAIPDYQAAVRSNLQSYRIWATGDAICREDAKRGIAHAKVPGMQPVYTDRNQYVSSTYVSNGNPNKQWFNVWMARYYGVKSVAVDNTVALRDVKLPTHTWSWYLYHQLGQVHTVILQAVNGRQVHAATQMQTATLVYVDSTGKQVGTEAISGNVGTSFDISHASVSGYKTTSRPTSYTFTAAANQTVTIHVTKAPTIARATLAYTTKRGRVVATEPINGAVGQSIDLTHASTVGYQTASTAPTTYRFTQATNQRVTMPVSPTAQGITVSYYVGNKRVSRVFERVKTGETIPVKSPLGYRLVKQVTRTMPAKGLGQLRVVVAHQSGWARLSASSWFWSLIVAVGLLLWDQIAGYQDFKSKSEKSKVK